LLVWLFLLLALPWWWPWGRPLALRLQAFEP
jgi:hypothetical protein